MFLIWALGLFLGLFLGGLKQVRLLTMEVKHFQSVISNRPTEAQKHLMYDAYLALKQVFFTETDKEIALRLSLSGSQLEKLKRHAREQDW